MRHIGVIESSRLRKSTELSPTAAGYPSSFGASATRAWGAVSHTRCARGPFAFSASSDSVLTFWFDKVGTQGRWIANPHVNCMDVSISSASSNAIASVGNARAQPKSPHRPVGVAYVTET